MSVGLRDPKLRPNGYRILGLISLGHAVTHMFSALMPLVYPRIMEQFGFSYTQLGLMTGLGNTLMSLMQGIYAFVMRLVPRRVILACGGIALAVNTGLMALTQSFLPFFILNILARVSTSPQHPVGNSLVAQEFGRKLRGTAFAINFAGGNSGTVLVPALGTLAIVNWGWRAALGVFALICLGAGMSCLALPAGQIPNPSQGNGKQGLTPKLGEWVAPLRERNARFVIAAAAVAAGGRGIGVVMVYVPLYFQQYLRLSSFNFALLFTIMMAGSVVGPLLVGRISDLLGRKRVAAATYVLSAAAVSILLLAGGRMRYLVPSTVFLGLVVYSQSSQIQALIADVSGIDKRDMTYSVFFTTSYLAGSIWSLALGFSVDVMGFKGAFLLMALSYFLGMLALLPVKIESKEG